MTKKLLTQSKQFILEHNKFLTLTFIVGFCRFFYIVLILAYNSNTLLTYRFEKGLSILTLFQYFRDLLTSNHLVWLAIIVIIIFAIGYIILYPTGMSASIHFLENEKDSIGTSIGKGLKDFFIMFEYNALAFSFGAYTYFMTILRLYILDVLNNGIILGLVCLWGACVLFASIFWQYTRYILVLENDKNGKSIGVFEAIKKSMGLSISHFGITIKGFVAKLLVGFKFYFKMAIIIAVPLLIIYFLITSDTIIPNNARIIWTIGGLTVLVATYLLTSMQAFFTKFRHCIYKKIKE